MWGKIIGVKFGFAALQAYLHLFKRGVPTNFTMRMPYSVKKGVERELSQENAWLCSIAGLPPPPATKFLEG